MHDEASRLRARVADLEDAAAQAGEGGPGGAPTLLVKTKSLGAYPTTAGCFYACESQSLTGTEVEGGVGALTTDGDTLWAFNCGSAVPPASTPLTIIFIGQRWVFKFDG